MSLFRKPDRPYWFCAYMEFDPKTRTSWRKYRSTKRKKKSEAAAVCRAWKKAAWKARHGKLSVDEARKIIAEGVADIFMAANAEALPSNTIKGVGRAMARLQANRSG